MPRHLVKLVAQRIALGILLLFASSVLIFAGTQILPGDVAQSILGQSATPEALANLRKELGLNEPAISRYLSWLGGVLQGDLGTALSNGASITDSILKRLDNTLFLAFWAALFSVPLSIFLGLISVLYRNKWPDRLISAVSLSTISVPEFIIGYVILFVLAVQLQWLPSVSLITNDMGFFEKLGAILMPVIVLTFVVMAHMMRMTRAAILNVMESAYIETAELKGLSAFNVIFSHAFPNAISPIVNVVMLNLAYLVVGVVVVEVVFVYPGMGQYLVDHVSKRDIPVVQSAGLIFASVYITMNMLADIIAIVANPRLRHPK
ncbi:ABC transporter permease [Kiloniella sp. b19]|uniref:ABC transporter permease n=1 Tax=Kiloniella sp. GXU_MW_B19 TaxID=3141326 RepID=UPI0031E46F17